MRRVGRIGWAAAVLAGATVFGSGGTAWAAGAPAADAPAAPRDAAWVDQKVRACQPTKAERRFDEIGWMTDIRSAVKLAREHGRPVFLFTHDGHMAVGRC